MKNISLAIMLVVLFTLVGCSQTEQEQVTDILTEQEPTMEQAEQTLEAMSEEDNNEEQEAMEEESDESEEADRETAYSAAVYTDNQAVLAESGPKVIYFHADWCPTCRALEERVNKTLSEFPDGTKIVKVNYDTEKELKKQYGIKVQTSLVILDESGNQVGDVLVNPSNEQLINVINQTL